MDLVDLFVPVGLYLSELVELGVLVGLLLDLLLALLLFLLGLPFLLKLAASAKAWSCFKLKWKQNAPVISQLASSFPLWLSVRPAISTRSQSLDILQMGNITHQ